MIINNIILNNYRLYQGKNQISFQSDRNKNIFLISGENGFGKTTFLHSLIWCLYGHLMTDVDIASRKDIATYGYSTFLKGNLNRDALNTYNTTSNEIKDTIRRHGYTPENEHLKDVTQYSVTINFSDVVIPSLPCTSLQVSRSYDILFEKESVEILIDGVKNELANEIGPEIFINDFILSKDIARFFFFDSEQIVALAETNTLSERRRLCSAYNEALGVRKYEDLKKNIDNLRLRLRRKSADSENRDKLLDLLKKRRELESKIEINNAQIASIEDCLKGLKTKDSNLQLQLLREGNGATTKEIHTIEEVIRTTKAKDSEYKKELNMFLEYAPIAITGKLLLETKKHLDEDKQKRKIRDNQLSRSLVVTDISNDFLNLLNKTEIPSDISALLKEQIKRIISKYNQGIPINDTILTLSEDDYEEFMSVFSNITTTYKTEFVHLADDYKKNRLILERNMRRLANIQNKENDEIIRKIRCEKNAIEKEIYKNETLIRSAHEKTGTLRQEFATLSKQISELSKKVDLDDSNAKKDRTAEHLSKELSCFLTSLKKDKKVSLERRLKTILNNLMHKEEFIGHVEVVINDDDMDIILYTINDVIINKDSLSKGEQQLYATSILKALVDESGIQFPVFIDSPLQKFDKSHAVNIITEFYPSISKQVVLFPLLHKELTLAEYEIMRPFVKSTYLIKNNTTRSYFEEVPTDSFLR